MTVGRHHGSALGLVLDSNVPIPGVAAAHAESVADVTVELDAAAWGGWLPRMGAAVPWYETTGRDDGRPWLTVWRGEAYRFEYAEGIIFTVAGDGARIEASWQAPLTVSDAVSYLLGPVLAFVLRLRGTLPLHASGVAVDGRALLFVGAAGAGKSSTAAAFAALGYPVLSDDVVPVRLTEQGLVAGPGHPRISLWPDAADAIWGRGVPASAVSAVYDKRVLDLPGSDGACTRGPVSLARIYLLGDRTTTGDVVVTEVTRRDGLLSLLAHTYGAYLLDADLRTREFAFLSLVAQAVAMRALSLPEDLTALSRACETLARTTASG